MDFVKLREYAEAEGSELGEAVKLLFELQSYSYCFEPEFNQALKSELKAQFDNFEENCEIIESTETVQHVTRELEWNN